MSPPERSPYLPLLPDPWPRPPDFRPATPVVADGEPVAVATSATPTGDSARPIADLPPGVAPEGQLRVTLSGRIGAPPAFRTTPKGRLIGKFPLGVRATEGDAKMVWHQILVFGERAEQTRQSLKRGDAVEVIGYKHERQVPGRTGPRTIKEVYATVVKPQKPR